MRNRESRESPESRARRSICFDDNRFTAYHCAKSVILSSDPTALRRSIISDFSSVFGVVDASRCIG